MRPTSASRSAAWALSVATARHVAGTATAADVEHAAGDVEDWPTALTIASGQGLLLLLARALSSATLPAHVHADLRAIAADEAARALTLVRRLVPIVKALQDAGIPALPYKGPLLSLQLYGELALRQSVDLDIVVSRADYSRARDVLAHMGFPARHAHTARQERALFGWLGHAAFGGEADFIELHWRFAPRAFPFALAPASAMSRAGVVTVAGTPLRIMARHDLLVTLCMHGARHLYERLEWLAGAARLIDAIEDADIGPVIEHATILRARRLLLASVGVAERVLGLRARDGWRAAVDADRESQAVAAIISDAIISRATLGTPLPEGARLQALYARLMDSPVERVRLLVRGAMLPTEREWELIRLPDALIGLYYVVRPLRLGVASVMRLLR